MRLVILFTVALLATGCTGGPLLPSAKTPTPQSQAAAQPTNTQPARPASSPSPAASPAGGSATPGASVTPTRTITGTVTAVASGTAGASVTPTRTITGTVTAVASRTGTVTAGTASPVAGGTVTTSVTGATPIEATEKYLLGRGVFGFDLALEGEVGDYARVRVSPKGGGSATTAYVQKQGNTWAVISYGGTAPSNVPPALQQLPSAPAGTPGPGLTPGVPGIVVPTVTPVPPR